jgi:metal-responsive CopG/Arc/MetJ family transcriptional regulator
MKIKTSITLSEDLVAELDRAAGSESRSAFIENVLQAFLRRRALDEEQERDRRLLDRAAARLNREAEEVLEYQALARMDED